MSTPRSHVQTHREEIVSAVTEPYVQTVDGPVAPEELGVTLTHEHVFLEMWANDGQGYVGQLRDEDVLVLRAHGLPRDRRLVPGRPDTGRLRPGSTWTAPAVGSQRPEDRHRLRLVHRAVLSPRG